MSAKGLSTNCKPNHRLSAWSIPGETHICINTCLHQAFSLHFSFQLTRELTDFFPGNGRMAPDYQAKSQVERLVRAASRCGPVGRPDGVGRLACSHGAAARTRRLTGSRIYRRSAAAAGWALKLDEQAILLVQTLFRHMRDFE